MPSSDTFVVDPIIDGSTWVRGEGVVTGQLSPKCFLAYQFDHRKKEAFYRFSFLPAGADADDFTETFKRDREGDVTTINGTPIGRAYITRENSTHRFFPDEESRSISPLLVDLPKNSSFVYDLVVSLGQQHLLAVCPVPNDGLTFPGFTEIAKPGQPALSAVTATGLTSTIAALDNAPRYEWSVGPAPLDPEGDLMRRVITDGPTVDIAGLQANTHYFVQARGLGLATDDPATERRGPWSDAARAWTFPAQQAAPTLVERTDTTLVLQSVPQSPNDPVSYAWKFATSEAGLATADPLLSRINEAHFEDLTPNTTYYFQVAIKANAGLGEFSPTATISAVTTMQWVEIDGLVADTLYHIRVKARNSAGDSDWSVVERLETLAERPGTSAGLTQIEAISNSLKLQILRGTGGQWQALLQTIQWFRVWL